MKMRRLSYGTCVMLVGFASLYTLVGSALALMRVQMPLAAWFTPLSYFGSLVPPMFSTFVPRPVRLALSVLLLVLAARRIWLVLSKRERTPLEFAGFRKWLGYVGFWSFAVSAITFLATGLFKLGSGVPGGLLMIPAVLCVPWTLFLTEIENVSKKRAALAV